MPMPDERNQFRILYRDFLSRMVDLELIAAGGDARGLIVRFGSMLAALSFILAYLIVPRYATSSYSHAKLARLAWSDEEFLISATIVLAGLCAVMAWGTVYPDRRDSLILGLIPVRTRTMILARVAAIGTVLGGAISVLNVFTGLLFPFALATGFLDGVRAFLTWWLVLCAAGAFIFCAGLVLQGVAAQLLPWRLFLRVSGLLQLAMLFIVLAGFFLAPPFDSSNPPLWIPSFWFVGLLHELRGDTTPLLGPLAAYALKSVAIVVPLAAVLYILSWSRNIRRIVESPDILPAKHARLANATVRLWSPAPFERAILLFTARTIARSRQHRLMLAIYGGFAFALSLAFSESLLSASHQSWSVPNGPLLLAGFLLLSCAVVGTRTIFALPIALPANWIFRITAVHRPAAYFAAVRKSLYTIAALPVWIVTAIAYLAIWPGRPALEHILVLALIGVVIVERSLYQFRKIPFTCSWLPGSTHGKMKAGIWGCVFLVLATAAAATELWTMETAARIIVLLCILGAAALRARYRTTEFAAEPDNRLQFEDSPPADIYALDLRQDGTWSGDEAYVEAIDPNMGRSLLLRLRPFAIGAVLLLTAGLLYEQAGEWRDRRDFPQIGRSVDIGGRSLNIYCSGTGSPAVIFDSGSGQPGYSWILVQPGVASLTRACWYDRAGYGWSDPDSEPRASADIADDLHKLLRAAGIPPPYVMVGHSFGGFNIRVYADRYRNDVVGMVLVDSADEFEDLTPESAQTPEPPLEWRAMARIADWLFPFGVGRVALGSAGPAEGHLSSHDSALINSVEFQEKSFEATLWESRGQSAAQVRKIRSLGSIPLVVLTAAATVPPPGTEMAAAWPEHMRNRIYGTQARLATLSTAGKQIILDGAGHDIPAEAPNAVIDAIQTVLSQVREPAPIASLQKP
jgi:pimeloyl-ACP methyl ester carboxylesterase